MFRPAPGGLRALRLRRLTHWARVGYQYAVLVNGEWRLEAQLNTQSGCSWRFDYLTGRDRSPAVLHEIGAATTDDVVITHDGERLFAYAPSQEAIAGARRAIDAVLRGYGIDASISISQWREDLKKWHQTEPPLTGDAKRIEEVAERDARTIQTRTLVASASKLVRAEYGQAVLDRAGKLGLQCEIVEHPHLLTTQVAYTVTGPRPKLDEFKKGLKAETKWSIPS